jgi:hypothetical protein
VERRGFHDSPTTAKALNFLPLSLDQIVRYQVESAMQRHLEEGLPNFVWFFSLRGAFLLYAAIQSLL